LKTQRGDASPKNPVQ